MISSVEIPSCICSITGISRSSNSSTASKISFMILFTTSQLHPHECRDETEDEDAQPQREIVTQIALSIGKNERVGLMVERSRMVRRHDTAMVVLIPMLNELDELDPLDDGEQETTMKER